MFLQTRTNESTKHYCNDIKKAALLLDGADHILLGIGSGMTASGGLNYADPALAEKWYPEYYAAGKRSILEIMSGFWPTSITDRNAAAFWGFWAKHIWHIRYEPEALQPYRALFQFIDGRDYFICTTNVDGQLEKAGFDREKIYAPQGDYALFQCKKSCSHDVYCNQETVETMLENMVSAFEIQAADIPRCPRCSGHLMPNLRCDMNFVEEPHIRNAERYERYLTHATGKNLVLLELGVGFNTPGIIRFPFEAITAQCPEARLIRINLTDITIPRGIVDKAIGMRGDVGQILQRINQNSRRNVVLALLPMNDFCVPIYGSTRNVTLPGRTQHGRQNTGSFYDS
jgi:NAD-dependent SIR2 family protein deacetylase